MLTDAHISSLGYLWYCTLFMHMSLRVALRGYKGTPGQLRGFKMGSSPVQYNLLLTADIKQRKQNVLNNEPNSDNSP